MRFPENAWFSVDSREDRVESMMTEAVNDLFKDFTQSIVDQKRIEFHETLRLVTLAYLRISSSMYSQKFWENR